MERLKLENIGENIIDDILKWIDIFNKNYDDEERIKNEDAKKLRESVNIWREEIRKELDTKPLYKIELKSGLDINEVSKLANNKPSEFIPEQIWKKLTEIEKSDYSDAAKCLILDTATPSVMVALRGAEASLGNYYRHKTQNDPGKKTWRTLTKELKENAEALGIQETFIGFLDYIGDAKRNFAQHPNKIYTLREAVVIFMQVIAMVEDIYTQM